MNKVNKTIENLEKIGHTLFWTKDLDDNKFVIKSQRKMVNGLSRVSFTDQVTSVEYVVMKDMGFPNSLFVSYYVALSITIDGDEGNAKLTKELNGELND